MKHTFYSQYTFSISANIFLNKEIKYITYARNAIQCMNFLTYSIIVLPVPEMLFVVRAHEGIFLIQFVLVKAYTKLLWKEYLKVINVNKCISYMITSLNFKQFQSKWLQPASMNVVTFDWGNREALTNPSKINRCFRLLPKYKLQLLLLEPSCLIQY